MNNQANMNQSGELLENLQPVNILLKELRSGLHRYWEIAHDILQQSGVTLRPPDESYFSYQKNFFSLLFLYSFYRAKIPESRRLLYAATLHCLRGMVTGCDNLLDDEYKITLDTDIPEEGYRFRSVVDIMISDRVLFQLYAEAYQREEISFEEMVKAISVSMKSMTQSGVQEASEEQGIDTILTPEVLLTTVHHFKTGILFTCPWDILLEIEKCDASVVEVLLKGLYTIGIGCQIMDDIVDFNSDLRGKRHNYLISLINHNGPAKEQQYLHSMLDGKSPLPPSSDLRNYFPASISTASITSKQKLYQGFELLLSKEHQFLAAPAIQFLQQRIGVTFKGSSEE